MVLASSSGRGSGSWALKGASQVNLLVLTHSTGFSYCVCLSLEQYFWVRRDRLIRFPPISEAVYGGLIRRMRVEKGRCWLKTAAGLRLLALASVKDSARFHANAPHHT
jgi:hypothetical protein